jgi:hypothetical protein
MFIHTLVNKLTIQHILVRGKHQEFSEYKFWIAFLLPVRYLHIYCPQLHFKINKSTDLQYQTKHRQDPSL